MKRISIIAAVLVATLTSVVSASATARSLDVTGKCAKGTVSATVGGKHVCLRVGMACRVAFNSAYRRHGFTCVAGHLRKKSGSVAPPPTTPASPPAETLSLTSAAFVDGAAIPAMYTCDGADISPPLSWTGAPTGTKSFALMVDDSNAPGGTFTHWITYDIPATATGLAAGQSGPKTGINDAGSQKYVGPCPPAADGPHHYVFHLYALGTDTVAFENDAPGRPLFLSKIAGLTLGRAILTATFDH